MVLPDTVRADTVGKFGLGMFTDVTFDILPNPMFVADVPAISAGLQDA